MFTPASIFSFEDLQLHLAPMLHVPILAIILTVAILVTLVDVVSGLEIEIPETAEILPTRTVGVDSFAIIVQLTFVQALAVQVLASHVTAILLVTVTAHHEILGDTLDAWSEN